MTLALVLGADALLHQAAHDLATALDRQFAPLGVTAQQAALLLHANRQQSSPSQLMSLLGTDTAGMTKLADRLEAKRLIARHPNPEDRRSVLIALTPDGQALVPLLGPVFGRVTRQLFDDFSPDEIGVLTTMLERIRANLAATATVPSA